MLYKLKPKHLMIFGIVCMLCGLGVFSLWNVDSWSHWEIAGTHILGWARENLGRYGITAIYFFGGILVFLRGYTAMRSEERSREIQQKPPFQ